MIGKLQPPNKPGYNVRFYVNNEGNVSFIAEENDSDGIIGALGRPNTQDGHYSVHCARSSGDKEFGKLSGGLLRRSLSELVSKSRPSKGPSLLENARYFVSTLLAEMACTSTAVPGIN